MQKKTSLKKPTKNTPMTYYAPASDVIFREENNKEVTVIKVSNTKQFFKLDKWAARIWILLSSGNSPKKILEAVHDESGINPTIVVQNFNKIISQFKELGIITAKKH